MTTLRPLRFCAFALLLFFLAPILQLSATTSADPDISLSKLQLLLRPLTKSELGEEATTWQNLVKKSSQEISDLTIAGTTANASELAAAREGKAAALDRFNLVIDELEAKGGDVEELRAYAKALAAVQIDSGDTGATLEAFTSWLKSKEGGIRLGLQSLKFIVIMLVVWILARSVRHLVQRAADKSETFSELLEQFAIATSFRLVMFIGLLVALATLGVNVGAMFAVIGGASFIIGFALQDTLGNFAAGVMLLIYRPFDVGDTVEVGGVNGKIDNVSLVSTTIRTFDNKVVLVPNKNVWGQVITNASASETRRVDMVFGISYDDDVEKAREILWSIVAENDKVLDEPEPTIQMNELADSSVNFICRPWTKTSDYWDVYWYVTGRVKQEFDKAGISFPFPQQEVHFRRISE
jgi:small conductance mechanosensitive channel